MFIRLIMRIVFYIKHRIILMITYFSQLHNKNILNSIIFIPNNIIHFKILKHVGWYFLYYYKVN